MRLVVVILWMFLSFTSCISDFTPEVKSMAGILVVDGMITDGVSEFRLSRSVGISDLLRDSEVITNAHLYIERNDGVLLEGINDGNGCYLVHTGDLLLDKEYRLCFSVNDRLYQSSFLKPIQTVEIDSLSYRKDDNGQVAIRITSKGGVNTSAYYRWSYRETWEVKARLRATHYYEKGVLTENNLETSSNSYYCWGRDSSKVLLLGTTKDLAENTVLNHKLYEIPCTDERFSVLYHVEISQTQLREEAYDYFRFMQDEIERTGGIFNQVMTAGDNGNIYCVPDPHEIIIGYIEVASTTKRGLYVPWRDVYLDNEEPCEIFPAGSAGKELPWVNRLLLPYTISTWRCVDCRMQYNATKDKPKWWPTDHL